MPRKPRIHYLNALYHVIIRGNHKDDIFFCDDDRMKFCSLLEDACIFFDCRIHGFCLMTNHVHLIVEVRHIPLYKIMQSINLRYAQYINKKMQRKGHLCEDRYKPIPIENEDYFLELLHYIHTNPVKHKLVKSIDELNNYKWSSHNAYLSSEKISWLTTDFTNKILQKHVGVPQKQYEYFIQNWKQFREDSSYFNLNGPEEAVFLTPMNQHQREIAYENQVPFSIEQITVIICSTLQVTINQVISSNITQKMVTARSFITYFAHYRAGHKLKDIANHLYRNPDNLSRTTHKKIRSVHENKELKILFSKIERQLVKK